MLTQVASLPWVPQVKQSSYLFLSFVSLSIFAILVMELGAPCKFSTSEPNPSQQPPSLVKIKSVTDGQETGP